MIRFGVWFGGRFVLSFGPLPADDKAEEADHYQHGSRDDEPVW